MVKEIILVDLEMEVNLNIMNLNADIALYIDNEKDIGNKDVVGPVSYIFTIDLQKNNLNELENSSDKDFYVGDIDRALTNSVSVGTQEDVHIKEKKRQRIFVNWAFLIQKRIFVI